MIMKSSNALLFEDIFLCKFKEFESINENNHDENKNGKV